MFYRKMGISEKFIFKIEKCPLVHEFSVHTHDFSELVIILRGTALHLVNGREYRLQPGDTFIIHGDVSHGYREVEGLEYVNIIFDAAMLQQLSPLKRMKGFQALFFIEPYYRKEQSFSSKLVLTPSQLKKAEAAADLLLEEFRHQEDGYQAMIIAQFTALLVMLSRNYSINSSQSSRKVLQIAEAVTYMEANFLGEITLSRLAEMACVSPRHFTRVFKKNYNDTPMDYVIRLRLNYAARLLKETSLSISHIAMESGFNDHNYFSRQFRRVYGVSPTESD